MRAYLALLVTLGGCGFEINHAPVDAPVDEMLPIDDMPLPPTRVKAGLIGLWSFDDAAGTRFLLDTSGFTTPVSLEVISTTSIPAPLIANGTVTSVSPGSRIVSETSTHLPMLPMSAGAVTLEVWARPVGAQGTASAPRFIAGLAKSISLRDIALLQSGDRVIGRVRTTPNADGSPDLVSSSAISTNEMTHIVLVADASQRKLYINGVVETNGAAGAPLGWDTSYVFALFDEPQHGRQWLGSLAMVALYQRGLTSDEVLQNFSVGP